MGPQEAATRPREILPRTVSAIPGCPVRVAGIVLLLLALLAAGPSLAQGPIILTILPTSEHHGALLPFDVGEVKNVGGVAARATLVERMRQEAPHVLLLDSGDILIGTAMSSVFRGEPDILAMNLMGYDAMAAGNHEFDFGLEADTRAYGAHPRGQILPWPAAG